VAREERKRQPGGGVEADDVVEHGALTGVGR
jgi:hypothetical protein